MEGVLDCLAILGTGLMGGSVGLAARRRGLVGRVVGYDLDFKTAARALQRGALDEVASSPAGAVTGSEIVLIATPVEVIPSVFHSVSDHLEEGAVVTDVGSTKSRVVGEIAAGSSGGRFIGGHPIAGSEHEGIEAADPELFRGCTWILTPTSDTDPSAYQTLVRFLGGLGARTLALDPGRHDDLVALTSHLPQVLASVLMGFASEIAEREGGLPLVTASGFRDMTRIAASSPELWVGILKENREAVIDVLRRFRESLDETLARVEREEWAALREALAAARQARNALPGKAGVGPHDLVELVILIPDEPGVLAEITTTVGETGVNIEDLDIVHSAEGGRGVLHLAIAGDAPAEKARRAIEARGYLVRRREASI